MMRVAVAQDADAVLDPFRCQSRFMLIANAAQMVRNFRIAVVAVKPEMTIR